MRRFPTSAVAATALALCASAPSVAQLPGIFDGDRKRSPIEMPRYRDRNTERAARPAGPAMVVIRADGAVSTVDGSEPPPPTAGFAAAIMQDAGMLASPGTAVLVLADGQRLTGALDVDKGAAMWVSPWVAPRELDLSDVRSLVFPGGTEAEAADEDVVELRNGDRVTGAVSSIMPDRVVVERGTGDATERFEVDIRNVGSINLVGVARPWSGVRAWLHDGTVINGPKADWLGSDHLQFPSMRGAKLPVVSVPRRMVAAIQSAPGAVIPLASMEPEAAHPASVAERSRREQLVRPSPTDGTWALDAPTLELEGPVVLRYPGIPASARLSCTLERPIAARSAGTPEFVVRSGGKEVARERLAADRASVEVTVPLGPGPFEVELSTADGSIAGCFVRLRRALVLPSG